MANGEQIDLKNFQNQNHAIDVCPSTNFVKDLPFFTGDVRVEPASISKKYKLSKNYEWSTTFTVNVDRETCVEADEGLAQKHCHLVYLENVFMLHFVQANNLRLTFFGDSEKHSDFFVPSNTWVHIQLSFSQKTGYELYLLDQDGKPVSK